MSDWKDKAIAFWERHSEGCAAQDAEHKANRIARAKEELSAALQKLNIPLPANAEIRVIDDPDFGPLPFATIDDTEFTFGPGQSRQSGHGGGLGIVTNCPRCRVRLRGPYIYDEK